MVRLWVEGVNVSGMWEVGPKQLLEGRRISADRRSNGLFLFSEGFTSFVFMCSLHHYSPNRFICRGSGGFVRGPVDSGHCREPVRRSIYAIKHVFFENLRSKTQENACFLPPRRGEPPEYLRKPIVFWMFRCPRPAQPSQPNPASPAQPPRAQRA